ncbi:hypothetical protein H8356DRAFT_1435722 [Neocallimastix lanati (nom. inval.)]|nr:hypothetical protein H8356DRAFT_1435722 [Neocallimastix sp. JGI-2020a]
MMTKLFFSSPIFNPLSRRFGELWTFKENLEIVATSSEELTPSDLPPHKINLIPGAKPVKQSSGDIGEFHSNYHRIRHLELKIFRIVIKIQKQPLDLGFRAKYNPYSNWTNIENYLNAILDFDKTVDFYLDSNLNNKEVVNWFNEGLNYSEKDIFIKYNITEEYKKIHVETYGILY